MNHSHRGMVQLDGEISGKANIAIGWYGLFESIAYFDLIKAPGPAPVTGST